MNREILFRGKTEQGEWAYGFYCLSSNNNGFHPSIITGTERGCFIPEFVNPSTVGQYTGLTDKNGTKIFEGDIVQSEGLDGVVEYSQKYGGYIPFAYFANAEMRSSVVEVIGNIHEEVQE